MKHRFMSLLLISTIVLSNGMVYADGDKTDISTETTTETTTEQTTLTSLGGGNHGGTTMTLSEFQAMIEDKSTDYTIDDDTMFNYMKNSLDAGEDISLSSAFSNSTGLEIPSNFMYDLSDCGMDGTLDASSINLQYADLTSNLVDSYNTSSIDLSNKAISATELFNNTYGDLASELQVEKATLPSDFSFSSLSAQNNVSISNAYNSAFSSSDYNTIKNTVSTRSVFEEASKGLTMPDLMDFDDLTALTADYNSELEANWQTTADESYANTWSKYQENLSRLDEYDEYEESVLGLQEGTKTKISETEETNADLRYKASTTSGNYIGKKIDQAGGYDWVDPFYEWLNGDAEENSKEYEKQWQEENGIYYDEKTQRYYKIGENGSTTESTTEKKTTESTTEKKTTESTTENKATKIDNTKEPDDAKDIYDRRYIN